MERTRLLLIGIDGLRLDVLDLDRLPALQRSLDGVCSRMTMPVPTNSGPCWSTLLTGASVAEHGVLDNRFICSRLALHPDLLTLAFLADRGLVHVRRMEFGTLDGILGCVAAGMGVTLIPRVVAEPARRAGRVSVHGLPDRAGRAETVLVHRGDGQPSVAFARFAEQVRTAFPA